MSSKTRAGRNVSGDTTADADRIEGPITEFDRYGEPTGHQYYACKQCGREAMRQRDLDDCCDAARTEATA